MHDGDKVQSAYTDFIDDEFVKDKIKRKMYIDFQLKNKTFGEWDEVAGNFTKITGNFMINGKIVNAKDIKNPIEYAAKEFGMTIDEFNLHNKIYRNYEHAITERVKKEFNKHKNIIYDVFSDLEGLTQGKYTLKENDISRMRDILSYTRESNIGGKYVYEKLNSTARAIESIKNNNLSKEDLYSIDLVGATALHKIISGNKDDSKTLYKAVLKDIDKFISRGAFDKFYTPESTSSVFNELTGIRNTGLTHHFATKLRMGAIELTKFDPNEIIEKIGESYNSEKLGIDTLIKIKERQKNYLGSLDLFVDNMIESAISAKHGLTLGGLEGSKIFIQSLLESNSKPINDKLIRLFDDSFIRNDKDKLLNLMENLAIYKKGFDDKSEILENVTTKLTNEGLSAELLYKYFDTGEESFKSLFGRVLGETKTFKYINYGKEYKKGINKIEKELYNTLMKNNYVDVTEFEMFRGLNLFGELLIQNDPGLEFDAGEVLKEISELRKGKITNERFGKFLKVQDIKNIYHQLFTSLGSAAAISNVGNMRGFLSSYSKQIELEKIYDDFTKDFAYEKGFIKAIQNGTVYDVINRDFTLKKNITLSEEAIKKLEYYQGRARKASYKFEFDLIKNKNNPMTVYIDLLNKNSSLFSSDGKGEERSVDMLQQFKERGVDTLNESSLTKGLKKVEKEGNEFFKDFIKELSLYDSSFEKYAFDYIDEINNGNITEFTKKETAYYINKTIDDFIFDLAKKIMPEKLHIKDKNQKMKKLRFSEFLSEEEKELAILGKIKEVPRKHLKNKFVFSFLRNSKSRYYIDDIGIFFDPKTREFDKEIFDNVVDYANKYKNLYFSERVAKFYFKNDRNLQKTLLPEEKRIRLSQDLLDAKRFLNEDFTKANVEKRFKFKFDKRLSAAVHLDRYLNETEMTISDSYKNKMLETLEEILGDFEGIDTSLNNSGINTNYVKLAETFVKNDKNYQSIRNNSRTFKTRFNNINSQITRAIGKETKWLAEKQIDEKLLNTLATIDLMNQSKVDSAKVNISLINAARIISGDHTIEKVFDPNVSMSDITEFISKNKKAGLTGLLATGALIAGNKIIPFFKKASGKYVINSNGADINPNALMDALDFTNGKKSNLITEETKGKIPKYVEIKKYFF